MKKKVVYSLDQIDDVVESIYALLPACQVFTLTGALGAGKTTLIKALFKRCGVHDVVTSPTFTYVNVYHQSGKTLYHFDLYRIGSLDGFCEAGFDEYLYVPDSWAFIEWPAVIMPLIQHSVCFLTIDYCGQERRLLTIEYVE